MSTLFMDGPAEGTRLELARVPMFLRVVIDGQGNVDALDQFVDEPRKDERVFVYRWKDRSDSIGWICSRGKGCRRLDTEMYRLYEDQPDDAVLRDGDRWGDWAQKQFEKE